MSSPSPCVSSVFISCFELVLNSWMECELFLKTLSTCTRRVSFSVPEITSQWEFEKSPASLSQSVKHSADQSLLCQLELFNQLQLATSPPVKRRVSASESKICAPIPISINSLLSASKQPEEPFPLQKVSQYFIGCSGNS